MDILREGQVTHPFRDISRVSDWIDSILALREPLIKVQRLNASTAEGVVMDLEAHRGSQGALELNTTTSLIDDGSLDQS